MKVGGTLKVLDAENGAMSEIERYRFAFIAYLEAAKKICKFNSEIDSINRMQSISESGRSMDPVIGREQEKQALEAEKILIRHYRMERTMSGFEQARCQFFADFEIAKKQEQNLWNELVAVVNDISCDDYEGKIWLNDDAESHRELLLSDGEESVERIHYYLSCLKDFTAKPDFPGTLETAFRLTWKSLIKIIPFSI